MALKSNLSCQVYNKYTSNGNFVFYVEVKPRQIKETEPALSGFATSLVAINIFDRQQQKSVVYYLNPELPHLLLEKAKGLLSTYSTQLDTKLVIGKTKASIRELASGLVSGDISSLDEESQRTYQACVANLTKTGKPKEVSLVDEVKTPNNKSVDENGFTVVRMLKILYNPISRMYNISIENCLAPPTNSQIGAYLSKKKDAFKLGMTFTEDEFISMLMEICRAKEMYARSSEASQIRYANENSWHPQN